MHGHSHHHHPGGATSGKRLFWVIIFNAVITLTEYIAGLLSGSLALISDAGHNLSDVLALILGYVGEKAGEKKPSARYTFGLRRAEVLVALINGLSLIAVGGYIVIEAVDRFQEPVDIDTGVMLPVAMVGLLGNVLSIFFLRHDRKSNLNMKAAFLHLAFDALSSVAVVAVGLILIFLPWNWLDLVVSLGIVAMMIWSSVGVIAESLRVIMQGVPSGLDPEAVRNELLSIPHVQEIHELHVWSVNSNEVFLSCHVRTNENGSDTDHIIVAINQTLGTSFDIHHTAIQIERADLCHDRE